MSRARRRRAAPVVPVSLLVLGVGLLSSPAAARPDEAAGSAGSVGSVGIGDPYWPLDGNGGIDVRHYEIVDRYDFASGHLSGTTTLTVAVTSDLAQFDLDLLLPVSSVVVAGTAAGYSRPDPHELQVVPATPLVRGDVVDVAVTYDGVPEDLAYSGDRNWVVGAGEVVTLGEPHMAPWWFASNDHPSDKATFEISVTGPATHQVVSNGRLVDRTVTGAEATTRWRSVDPMTTYSAFFALGRYEVEQTSRDGLPSYVAVSRSLPPHVRTAGMAALRRSDDLTAWLAGRLGPYPFESTGGLITSLTTGFALENQTRPVYPGVPRTGLLVHELAHQWFGDSVSVRRWRDIWLNEGFATFMEVVYDERHGGRPAQQWLRETRNDQVGSRSFWAVDLTDPGAADLFAAAVYQRGGMALQALRHRIGEGRFWRLVRTWVRDHRHGNSSSTAFRALAERVSGQRLDGFFRAWLRAPRAPSPTRAHGLR